MDRKQYAAALLDCQRGKEIIFELSKLKEEAELWFEIEQLESLAKIFERNLDKRRKAQIEEGKKSEAEKSQALAEHYVEKKAWQDAIMEYEKLIDLKPELTTDWKKKIYELQERKEKTARKQDLKATAETKDKRSCRLLW